MTKLRFVYVFFLLAFLALSLRLFYWQIVKAKDLAFAARGQYQFGEKISAPRGNILASDGSWLVARGETWKAFAWLPDIEDVGKTADALVPFFVTEDSPSLKLEEANRLKALMLRDDVSWVPLKSKLSKEVKDRISALDLPGIGFDPEEARVYPEASTAANTLGFVGKDDEGEDIGYFGLEGYYNLPLSGKPGFLEQEKDAAGTPIFPGTNLEISAIEGVDLLTHIDKGIQVDLDKKLAEGVEKYGAKGGNAVIMDPKTGAVLASSSYPSYDPAKYYEYGDEFFKDQVVGDPFEPGSVFKVIVMAAGVDAGLVDQDTKCDICDRPYRIDKYEIKTWNNEYHPDSTMTDVIVHSDNVGMVFVAKKLGSDALYDYLDKFGIGKKTEIDLQGEVDGTMRARGTWNDVDLATASFGQGIAVTPIQMAAAVSVIANGGYQVTPQVVDKLVGSGWEESIRPKIGQKILSDKAVSQITAMMEAAASEGESKRSNIAGFRIAGKTGTAQIPIAGHYDEKRTNASFVGFAPADDPKFVMFLTLKEPQTSQWASETAAPLWYSIAQDLFLHLGIQPK